MNKTKKTRHPHDAGASYLNKTLNIMKKTTVIS